MRNPWTHLPTVPPFIFSEDEKAIEVFNDRCRDPKGKILLDQLPSPYVGNPDAPIILLNLNPGYGLETGSEKACELFSSIARSNFLHQFDDYPFYPFNPALAEVSQAGHEWWKGRVGPLMRAVNVGWEELSKKIFCVEYFPYHSVKYQWKGELLPSQRYSVHLVGNALKRNPVVIVMRGERIWREAVPFLTKIPYATCNPQKPYISEGNIGANQFAELVRLIKGS